MPATILVRYGELALKSPPVRREFERTLQRNIVEQFRTEGRACRLTADHGHLYVMTEEPAPAVRILRRVFGITSVSVVTEVPTDRAEITRVLLNVADPLLSPGRRFAIRARRTGSHNFTSQGLARDLGSEVLEKWPDRGLIVDLDHPDVELNVEVRGPKTYLYVDRHSGPGGLPLGVAGRVVALVDGPRGALGAFLMMKRGCRCAFVPTLEGERLTRDVLARFDPQARVERISTDPVATLESVAESTHADAVVLPLPVESYPESRQRWGDRVLFSPTVGFNEQEVGRRWQNVEELAA